jgi:DNA primase
VKTMTATRGTNGWDFLDSLDNPVPSDVCGALGELGVEVIRETQKDDGTEILARCPMHEANTGHPDRHPSFWVNATSGCFICFSCQYQGAFTQLVADALNIGPVEAGRWVISHHGASRRQRKETVKRVAVYTVGEPEYSKMEEPPLEALRERNLKQLAAQSYGLRWRDGAWILPIRNQQGDLMGWQEKRGHTFINRPNEVKKSASLFGWNRFTRGSTAILVESPLDAVRIASVGIPGALASYGAAVSDVQMQMINQNASSLILALDNPFVDRAGRHAAEQIYRRWSAYGMKIKLFDYRDMCAKDPGDMTDEQIETGINNAFAPWRLFRVHG